MSCYGHWIINNVTIDVDAQSEQYSRLGYIFTKSNTETQGDKHIILRLSVNASKTHNNTVIQCEYQPVHVDLSDLNFTNFMRSRTARVFVMPSEFNKNLTS
jgi:hypothetical protein